MEGFEFIEYSFKIMREKLEAEYVAKLQEHRENISTELNKLEFTENYGRLPNEIEMYVKHIPDCTQPCYEPKPFGSEYFKHHPELIKIILSDKHYIVHVINYTILTKDLGNVSTGNNNCFNLGIKLIHYEITYLLIDNCGNLYSYTPVKCAQCKKSNNKCCGSELCNLSNKLIPLNKNISCNILTNNLIDFMKQINIPKKFYSSDFNKIPIVSIVYNSCGNCNCQHFMNIKFNNTLLIDYFINIICTNVREMNEYYYKQFVDHLPYETLKAKFDEISEEKHVFDEKYDKIENKYKIASEKLSATENELNHANSTLLAYKAEIDKLNEKIHARDALIVNLTIQNAAGSAPPPYSA